MAPGRAVPEPQPNDMADKHLHVCTRFERYRGKIGSIEVGSLGFPKWVGIVGRDRGRLEVM